MRVGSSTFLLLHKEESAFHSRKKHQTQISSCKLVQLELWIFNKELIKHAVKIHTYLALDIDPTVFVFNIEGPRQLLHVSDFTKISHNIIRIFVLCLRH